MSEPLKMGQRVAIYGRGEPHALGSVTRVTKRFVEVTSGHQVSRWSLDGWDRYPRGGRWDTAHIRAVTREQETEIRRAWHISTMRSELVGQDWHALPAAAIEAVHAALESSRGVS